MATIVQCASCYAQNSIQSTQLFRRESGQTDCMALFMYRVPNYVPRPRLAYHAPKMTLRQICRMLRKMKQVRKREVAAATNSSEQDTDLLLWCLSVSTQAKLPKPTSLVNSDRCCLLTCCRRRRTVGMKRFV